MCFLLCFPITKLEALSTTKTISTVVVRFYSYYGARYVDIFLNIFARDARRADAVLLHQNTIELIEELHFSVKDLEEKSADKEDKNCELHVSIKDLKKEEKDLNEKNELVIWFFQLLCNIVIWLKFLDYQNSSFIFLDDV